MSIYKKIAKNINELRIDNPLTKGGTIKWLNITDAGKKEIQYLRQRYNFSLNHLQAASVKASSPRPIVEKGPDYLFIIIHFPSQTNGIVHSGEIEFFIGKDFLVTMHDNIQTLNKFFNFCKKDVDSMLSVKYESVAVLLFEILEKLMLDCYNIIDKTTIDIAKIEEIIFSLEPKKAVSDILVLRRNVINMRKIMQNHKNIIKKLIEFDTNLVREKDIKKYYFQLLDLSKRIWESLENQKEMVEVLNSTNESMLNYHISDIMKTLTIFSVIVFPLTLFAAVFGMNTVESMPFVNHPLGFWYIVGIMLVASLLMLLFFERKNWLK